MMTIELALISAADLVGVPILGVILDWLAGLDLILLSQ
jgi:hypothetical protein